MSDEQESVTLRSGDFSAKVMREGAELRSFLHTPSGREFIWQADPEIWGSSAPVLFPIVGKLKDDRYTWGGQSFSMSGHGVVRRRELQVTELGEDHVMLQFDADSTSLAAFPFPFTLQVEFVLSGTLLNVDYRVSNTGTEVMPFTLGSHPAFSLHPQAGGHDDYDVEFSNRECLDLYTLDGPVLRDSVTPAFINNSSVLPLRSDSFDSDALIFKNIRSDAVTLVDRFRGPQVRVTTGGAPHLGIWAKPGGRYICIEPWFGYADHESTTGRLEDKPAMMRLDVGEEFQAGYQIEVLPSQA